MSTPLVTGVDFVTVNTRDLDSARHFYGEVLGLEKSKVWQPQGGEAMGAEFENGTVTIALFAPEKIGREFKASSSPIAFQVADVAAARAELEGKGVEFAMDTIDSGVCHMAVFEDPDGNALMLHHRYAPKHDD